MTATRTRTRTLTSNNAPLRAVIYCRISFDRTGEGLGVDRQEAACRTLAEQRGWQIIEVIIENDQSALKRRPKYDRMIKDAEHGDFDVVISWAMDRLTRTPQEVEDVIKFAEQTGLIIATANGDIDLSTDTGRMVARILASVARQEVERKTARMVAAYRQSAEAGEQPRVRAFGYRKDGSIDPAEAPAVREAYARFVAGQGAWSITRWMNEQGHVNTKGQPWSYRAVAWMLRNPRYAAERWHMFDPNGGLAGMEYVGPGDWEAIIDAETFAAARAKVADNAVKYPAVGPNRKHLGSGLLMCGVCGKGLRGYWQTQMKRDGGTRKYLRYGCYPSRHLIRRAPELDELVIAEVVDRLRNRDVLAALMAQEDIAVRGRELVDRANGLRGSLADLADAMALPRTHPDYLSPALAGRAEQKITAELAEIDARLAQVGDRSPLALVAGAADPGAAWLELRTKDLRAAQEVAKALVTITVMPATQRGRAPFDPTTVIFDWREPGESAAAAVV